MLFFRTRVPSRIPHLEVLFLGRETVAMVCRVDWRGWGLGARGPGRKLVRSLVGGVEVRHSSWCRRGAGRGDTDLEG